MKRIFLSLAVVVMLTACGNDRSQQSAGQTEMNHDADEHEHEGTASTTMSNASMDGPIRKSDKAAAILDSYLAIKNALASDNSAEAATSGEAMVKAFASFDRASLDAKRQSDYDEIVEDAREHAEHIGENSGKIDHQREHFDLLSKDMMELVSVVGSDRTLYLDHCPMYNDNKGADWLSVSERIENPYYGSKMLTCGSMKNEIVPQ
ncbi:DUF3347 domain-containing protein [Persicitalea jodogahamensis]|nr:DUF3347 domain-containing protein [Persicitalea jodogahamensis]